MSPLLRAGRLVLKLALAPLVTACTEATAPEDRNPAALIFLSPPSAVAIGATAQLSVATLNDNGVAVSGYTVTWESLAPSVATVSASGLVTGVSSGTVQIRARSGDKQATMNLTVNRAACTAAMATSTYTANATAVLSVGPSDCQIFGYYAAVGRRMVLSEPTSLRLSLTSAQHPVFLLVTDAQMAGYDGASADLGSTATVTVDLPAGTHYVWAIVYAERATGSFTLTSGPFTRCAGSTTAGSIIVGQAVNGAVAGASCLLPNDLGAEGWAFSVSDTTTLRFTATGSGIVPYLFASGAGTDLPLYAVGQPTGPATNVLQYTFAPGEYRLWVASVTGGVGTYTLAMATASVQSCDSVDAAIAVGDTIVGTLDFDDCTLPSSQRSDIYELTVASDRTVRIDQRSGQMDTYLFLRSADGTIIAEDDDGGEGLDSRITIPLTAGTYRILASSYSSAALGDYSLSVVPEPAAAALSPATLQESGLTLKRQARPAWDSPPYGSANAARFRLR